MRLLLIILFVSTSLIAENLSVGLEGVIEYETPAKVIIKRKSDKSKVYLRIISEKHTGRSSVYKFAYIINVAGEHDLKDFLEPIDESKTLPSKIITANAILSPDHALGVTQTDHLEVQKFGFYRTLLTIAAILWVLIPLILYIRKKIKNRPPAKTATPKSASTADKLRPLLEKASQGQLELTDQVQIESLLVSFWKKKLSLNGDHSEILQKLRNHDSAAEIFKQIDKWLYQPEQKVPDFDNMLAVYEEAAP